MGGYFILFPIFLFFQDILTLSWTPGQACDFRDNPGQSRTYHMYALDISVRPGPEVIKLSFILNSVVHEIYPANKYQNTNNFNIFSVQPSKHEIYLANKY